MKESKLNSMSLTDQQIEAMMKKVNAQKENENNWTDGSRGKYQVEKYVADVLNSAKATGARSYFIPILHMNITLKEGVRLIDFIEKYFKDRFKGAFDSVLNNKEVFGS